MKVNKISLLKCKPIDELLYLCDVDEYHLKHHKNNGIIEYIIPLTNINALMLYYFIKDFDFYDQGGNYYISDYIFLKKVPTTDILKLLNFFSSDDLFVHCISKQMTIRAQAYSKQILEKKLR